MPNLFLFVLVLISSFCVFASDNAPPALPSEFWGNLTQNGNPVQDGLTVAAEIDGVNYAQASVTHNGYYDVLLIGGDKELTYDDDMDCSVHFGLGEACVPCSDEADCIEGPQDGELVEIKVDNSLMPINDNRTMPYVEWQNGFSDNVDLVTPIGDWDKAGCVDMADVTYFANHYGETPASPGWNNIYDLVRDFAIDMTDITVFASHYGDGCQG